MEEFPDWPNWFQGVSECEAIETGEEPFGVGSKRRIIVDGIEAEEEFIGWEANKLFAFTAYADSLPVFEKLVERLVLEPTEEGGTKLIYDTGMEFRLLGKLFSWLLPKGFEKSWSKSLTGLDEYIENKKKQPSSG